MKGHEYTRDVKCHIFQTWALHGSKSASGEILAPFHYASERSPSTNHTESSADMTDVLNMVENIETFNRQTEDSLLLTQLMYSYSLLTHGQVEVDPFTPRIERGMTVYL